MLLHYLWQLKVDICNKFSRPVMMAISISKHGLTDLIFVHPGVKINSGYYHDMLLSQQLLPVTHDMSGDFFIFQQDSAPAHRVCDTAISESQHPLSFLCGCQIAPTFIRSITRYGVTSSSECISRSYTALMNWRTVRWTLDTAWTTASLTMQLMGGISILEYVYGQKVDISSSCCKLDNGTVCLTIW